MKKTLHFLALAILLFGLSAYGQTAVQVTKLNSLQSVALKSDQVLEVKLPSTPSTGFGWYLKNNDQRIVEQAGDWEFVSDDVNNSIGTPGIQTIKFIGKAEGVNELEFLYKRPWEDDSQAIDNYKITVSSEGVYSGKPLVSETIQAGETTETPSYAVNGLPTSFSWLAKGLCTPCKNQGSCGSCWTFAACGSFESVIKIFDNVTTDLSEQWLVNCDKRYQGCSGGWCPNSMFKNGAVYEADQKYMAANGTCKSSYTYHEKIKGSYEIATNPSVEQIKQAIYDYGPVWIAVNAGSNFSGYKGGTVLTKSDAGQVNHAVVLVGWDDATTSWVLRNSWGTGWGENKGYMRIKYGISSVGYKATYIDYKGKIPHTPTAIENNAQMQGITLYPNPNTGTFVIEGLEKQNNIEVYDVVGKLVYKTVAENSVATVNLSSTGKGVYFYKITNISSNAIQQGKIAVY